MKSTRSSFSILMASGLMACGDGASASHQVTTTQDLCSSNEQVVFSCLIKGRKRVASVCASAGWRRRDGYIVYRYGRPGHVELAYPEEDVDSFDRFYYSSYVRPLVTRQSLRFKSGDYEYVIETISDEEQSTTIDEARLLVTGRRNVELTCETSGRVGIDVGVSDVVPCDPEGMDSELSCGK